MIPSAVNIPLTILPESLKLSSAAFVEKFGFEKPRTGQEVIFYCRSGKRSASASDIAKRNGYTKLVALLLSDESNASPNSSIFNYSGSWLEWTEKQSPKASHS